MLLFSQSAVNGMQAGADAEVPEADNFPMHAVLREFNQSYAATMTAEAYARYAAAAAFSMFMLGSCNANSPQSHDALCKKCKSEIEEIGNVLACQSSLVVMVQPCR